MASWQELEARKTEPQQTREDRYAALAAACFTTPAGRLFLDFLHELYIDGVMPVGASDSALREMNAKRHLVREIERKTAEGLANRSKASK